MRDDFSQKTKEDLAKRVGYRCSNPQCRQLTIGANESGDGIISVGEAAHICAASPGGKRYDVNMTSEERASIDNGIWLCRNCAAMTGMKKPIRLCCCRIGREWQKLKRIKI